MKFYVEMAGWGLYGIAAALWFVSASIRLTKIGPGQDELDHVTKLADDLQDMGRWNRWAALCTGAAVLMQVLVRYWLG
jgi:hypothetical protein